MDWSSTFATHRRWLRTVVFARVGEMQAVDDVMQEVAAAAVQQSSPVRDPERISGWLYRLAVRYSLLYRRKQGRDRRRTSRYAMSGQSVEANENDDPLVWMLADERKALIRQALERLPARDREVLLLKYVENWSYRRMAEQLDLSASAVEARLHRSRQRMRNELSKVDIRGIEL